MQAATSQDNHGKKYETYIKGGFPGSSDYGRTHNSEWDIESKFDTMFFLPSSVKTTGSSIVCLADARKFWNIDQKYRLLISVYDQVKDIKRFHTLYEFLPTKEEHNYLLGDVSREEIEKLHNMICSISLGNHIIGRKLAQNNKSILQARTKITLNPKIDSKNQRRLQCSVSIDELKFAIKHTNIFKQEDFYRGLGVAINIQSPSRRFRKQLMGELNENYL